MFNAMKDYYGTKHVRMKAMNRGEYVKFRGWDLPSNEDPTDEGYLVEYTDGGKGNHPDYIGYITWTPKASAEAAYQPFHQLSFGHAIVALESGRKVCRAGWNGKGMFLYYVPANSYPAQTQIAKLHFKDGMVPYGAYIAMKTADENVVPWTCSQTDMAAKDWMIID